MSSGRADERTVADDDAGVFSLVTRLVTVPGTPSLVASVAHGAGVFAQKGQQLLVCGIHLCILTLILSK